jgi:hypothetical protein
MTAFGDELSFFVFVKKYKLALIRKHAPEIALRMR